MNDKKRSSVQDEASSQIVGEVCQVVNLPDSHLRRDLGLPTLICFGFSLSSSWVALGLSSVIAIAQGGTVTLIYGILVIALPYVCTGLTMAELISVYPTAGGQYHFASILAPRAYSKVLSYISGVAALFSWLSMSAGTFLMSVQLVLAIVIQFRPDYTPTAWHAFLLYEAFNILSGLYNIFLLKRSPRIYDVSFALSVAGLITIPIVCLARSETKLGTVAVWTTFTNNTGWSDAICFITGLVTPAVSFGALDSTMHLVEETKDPRKAVPRAICSAMIMGLVTTFPFAVAMVYCMTDVTSMLATPTGLPIYALWQQATRSTTAATVFIVLLLTIDVIVCVATVQTTSRLTWALGRDNAFLGSKYLAAVHNRLEVPVWSILVDTVVVGLLGILYLISTTAFNSFLGVAVQLLNVSFAIPAMLLIYQKRSSVVLPVDRQFRLSHPAGYFCHVVCICWALFTFVFFMFPTALPVTTSSMNYSSVVVAIGIVIVVINWIVHAGKEFQGPVIEFSED